MSGSKFTLTKARTVDNHTLTDDELTSPDQIPYYILQTLMIGDYRAREFKLRRLTTADKDNDKNRNTYDSDEEVNEDEDSDSDESLDNEGINPIDALLWTFHCSDIFLRRALAIKLSTCQLSVPFLLPDPTDPSKNVTILLSALESITKCWKGTPNESTQEVFATEHPFPVVSFIRIGEVTMSKSFLINKIMSDGNVYHDFFFHKNMQGGEVERKVVDGLVELCWYLPGGGEKQTLKSEICFANLRGDARRFKKQVDVLLKISSVLCILLNSGCPDEEITTFLKKTTNTKANVILVFNEKRQKDAIKYFKNLRNGSSSESGKLSSITFAKKNEYIFLEEMRRNIQHEAKTTPLVELESCLNKFGIQHDDDQSHFNIDTLLNQGIEKGKGLLKLQMHVPVLADLERKKYRTKRQGNKSTIGEIYKGIKAEREAQIKSLAGLDKGILQLLNFIAVTGETERNCTLSKVKHQLDKMSLQVMAKLHQNYRDLQKKEKETCPEKTDSQSSKENQNRLRQLEESLTECSFGLEHIIRELAQLYELSDVSTYDYAGAAAEMLLSGQPLELLDGDSSYIPLEWFNAVYTSLQHKTKNAKVFVISVLGIQSSGKTTMLNTMFGLEFPVSAGRCTRGAFASLIPVSDSLKDASNFDYILVIDTEGLTGCGGPQRREHDNELSTFAIGVADVTIVNVFGENHNEMKEFLEIAVHAFLKMRLVKEKKSCKIVHQNVAATDARDKLMVARGKLKQDLDKMTMVAAIQENCEDKFKQFNDIISFNENDDVFYIPNFFKGNPPMAPVNPNYGRATQKLRENICKLICSKGSFQLSVFNFRERVTSLWNAMLKENFIFSFRNTIEVRAYTSLDREYFDEYVNLMVIGMGNLERKIQVALKGCTTRQERVREWADCKMEIVVVAEALRQKFEKKMKVFFDTSQDKATLKHWKEHVMIKINQSKENQVMEVTKNCSAAFQYWQDRQDVDEKKQVYEKLLLQKAKKFVTSAHYTGDIKTYIAVFEQEWQQWIADVLGCQENKIDVNIEMIHVLCETNSVLSADMAEKIIQKRDCILEFRKFRPRIDFDQLQISWLHQVSNYLNQQQVLSSVRIIEDQVITEALKFAEMTLKSGARCTRNNLRQMYHKVITIINREAAKLNLAFRKSLVCDFLLYAFAHTFNFFQQMEERYFQERDIRGELERNLRPTLEYYFVNTCNEMMGKEVSAATLIVKKLQKPLESELNHIMGVAVLIEVKNNVSECKSKGQFQASVLIKLGEKAKFESYIPYLENPVKFLKGKLMESIENYCLNDVQGRKSIMLLLANEAKNIENKVIAAVSTASKLTKSGNDKLTFWIKQFVDGCSTLDFKKELFQVTELYGDLKEIDVFEAKIRENVTQYLESLVKCGIDLATIRKWNPSLHDQFFTSLFGCQQLCPFCKVLCDKTMEHLPTEHSTKIHRPQCLNDCRNFSTGRLDVTICTKGIADKFLFQNSSTFGKWHPYEDYRLVNDYYKSWNIASDDTFEASKYWQWFTTKFSKELAKHFNAKEPVIPEPWEQVTFEKARDQLKRDYNLE